MKYNAALVKHCGFSSCHLLLIHMMHVPRTPAEDLRSLQNWESHIHKKIQDKSLLLKPSIWDFYFFFLNPGERIHGQKSEVKGYD